MVGTRIRSFRKSKKLTLAQLSEKIGISLNSLASIETAKTKPSSDTLESLVENTDINPDWLIAGRGSMIRDGGEKETVEVEVLTLAGLGDLYELQGREPLEVAELAKDLVINVGRVTRTAVRARGDSMYPTICDGALVGVDFGDREPVDNGIFLLRFRDLGLTIKRLRFRADGYLVVADNPTVSDELVPRDHIEEGFIAGRVRWIYNRV